MNLVIHDQCVLASLCMVLDISPGMAITALGHDGSEIVFPDAVGKYRMRGISQQECLDVAWEFNHVLVAIFPAVILSPGPGHSHPLHIYTAEQSNRRARMYMDAGPCMIYGVIAGKYRHCVACDGGIIYDPGGRLYPFEELKMDVIEINLCIKSWR